MKHILRDIVLAHVAVMPLYFTVLQLMENRPSIPGNVFGMKDNLSLFGNKIYLIEVMFSEREDIDYRSINAYVLF